MSCLNPDVASCWDLEAIEIRCYKLCLRLVTFAVLISADIVQKMATEAMVSKLECYHNYVEEYNATDGSFQGESQKLGRHILVEIEPMVLSAVGSTNTRTGTHELLLLLRIPVHAASAFAFCPHATPFPF